MQPDQAPLNVSKQSIDIEFFIDEICIQVGAPCMSADVTKSLVRIVLHLSFRSSFL